MRVRRKTITGRFNSKGALEAPWDMVEAFGMLHRDQGVIVRFEIVPKEPSERLANFVFGYVIPELQGMFHDNGEDYTKEQTYNRIRELCPVFLEETYTQEGWKRRVKSWEELDSAEAVEFVAWVQRWCAENYSFYIADPE